LCPSSKRSVAVFLGYKRPVSIEHGYYKFPKKMWICLFGGAQTLLSAKVNALKNRVSSRRG